MHVNSTKVKYMHCHISLHSKATPGRAEGGGETAERGT